MRAQGQIREPEMSSGLTIPRPRGVFTTEQYLALERPAPERHEYLDGEIIAMAGEKVPHGLISTNLIGLFVAQLKGTPCFAVAKDTKVRSGLGVVPARNVSGMFSYPDILIVCGEPEYFDDVGDVIVNPSAIVEVLSPSTESFDRGEKFPRYRTWNATLNDYLLVSQTRPFVEHFRRLPDGTWNMRELIGLDATVTIESIGCALKLADVYDRITFSDQVQD